MSVRRELLNEAADLVDGDRNAQYGDPNQDFRRTGRFWSTYLAGVAERKLTDHPSFADPEYRAAVVEFIMDLIDPQDVAWMQIFLKGSRSTVSPGKRDHYADAAGYAACGYHTVHVEDTDSDTGGDDDGPAAPPAPGPTPGGPGPGPQPVPTLPPRTFTSSGGATGAIIYNDPPQVTQIQVPAMPRVGALYDPDNPFRLADG